MKIFFLFLAGILHLAGNCQNDFDSQILDLIADIPNNFKAYWGTKTELGKETLQYDSKILVEGTQKNVIYVFNDSNADLPASYYLATIDSTSNTKPKKLFKQWVKKLELLHGTPMTKENYSVNMPALGLATGTLFQGPNFEIRLYYQKNPLTKLYSLYLAIAQRK